MKDKERKDLAVVLHGQRRRVDQAKDALAQLETDREMDLVREGASAILGDEAREPPVELPLPLAQVAPALTWAELVGKHDRVLADAGVEVENIQVDDLLSEKDRVAIEAEWAIWPEREPWRWPGDFIAVGAAGLSGGLLDLFAAQGNQWISEQVGKETHDEVLKRGEGIYRGLHGSTPTNPMSGHRIDARIPDGLRDGLPQDYHRAFGPTHDICRIREALNLMMGTQHDFEVGSQSVAQITRGLRKLGVGGDAALLFRDFETTGQALTALLIHWLADFFSTRGLPIPGTSWLVDQGGTLKQVAVELYKNGFTLRELLQGLSRLSGVTLTSLFLRLWITVQHFRDGERSLTQLVDWSSRNRYIEMFTVAHGIAAGVGGVAAAATWNPSFLNGAAILAAAKNAIHLAVRVHREKRAAIRKFGELVAQNNKALDEMAMRSESSRVAALLP